MAEWSSWLRGANVMVAILCSTRIHRQKGGLSLSWVYENGERRHISDQELEEMAGFAPGELEATAAMYESGEWPSGRTVRLGRPPIADEETQVVASRVGESVARAFAEKAARHGQTKAERLRELVTNDVLTA